MAAKLTALVTGAGESVLLQTAFFAPRGLSGLVYWHALYPIHALIFSGLVERIAERAELQHQDKALSRETSRWKRIRL